MMTCAATFPGIKETMSVHTGRQYFTIIMKVDNVVVRTFILQSEFVEHLKVEVAHAYKEPPPRKTYAVITFLAAAALASFAKVSETIPPLLLVASAVVMAVATVYFLVTSVTSGSSPLQQSEAREAEFIRLRRTIFRTSFREIIKSAALKEVLLPVELQGIYKSYYESICRDFLKAAPDLDAQRQSLNAFIKQNPFKQDVLESVYTEVSQGISQLASLCETYSKIEREIEGRVDRLLQIQKERVQGLENRALIAQHESCRKRFMELIESHDEQIVRDYYACAQALVRAVLKDPRQSVEQDYPKNFPTFITMLSELRSESQFGVFYDYMCHDGKVIQ
jgi:hypothetical protein